MKYGITDLLVFLLGYNVFVFLQSYAFTYVACLENKLAQRTNNGGLFFKMV